MVKALRQLASATLLVEFSVMQLTMDLQKNSKKRHLWAYANLKG